MINPILGMVKIGVRPLGRLVPAKAREEGALDDLAGILGKWGARPMKGRDG
jgi:hypothetical protein